MNQTQLVERVLKLSEAIEHATLLADWPTAMRLSEERQPLLMSITAEQTPEGLAAIRRVQMINESIKQQSQTWRRELDQEFVAVVKGRRAVRAYQSAARL